MYLKFNLQSYSIFNSLLRILFMAMNSSGGQKFISFQRTLTTISSTLTLWRSGEGIASILRKMKGKRVSYVTQ
jgi:hypothetical protein